MDGIYKSEAERDKAIFEILNNVKFIITQIETLNKCINDHESRLRYLEKTQAQHSVWLEIFGGMAIGSALTALVTRWLK